MGSITACRFPEQPGDRKDGIVFIFCHFSKLRSIWYRGRGEIWTPACSAYLLRERLLRPLDVHVS